MTKQTTVPEVIQRGNFKWYFWDGKTWSGPFDTEVQASAALEQVTTAHSLMKQYATVMKELAR